jgi:hypothetical protein
MAGSEAGMEAGVEAGVEAGHETGYETGMVTSGDAARAAQTLSERDREILAFERQWWKYAGAKEHAIREKFDMSATRYYQVLNALIDHEAAIAYDPLLVKRLRRLRSARQRARSARRLGFEV